MGRTNELARFLDALAGQNDANVRVILVDQNEDARLDAVIAGRPLRIERIRGPLGLSRARNAATQRAVSSLARISSKAAPGPLPTTR